MNIAPVTGRRSARGAFLPTGLCIFVYFRGSWRRGKLKSSLPDRVRVMCAKTGRGPICARDAQEVPRGRYLCTPRPNASHHNAIHSTRRFLQLSQLRSRHPVADLPCPCALAVLESSPRLAHFLEALFPSLIIHCHPLPQSPSFAHPPNNNEPLRTDLSTLTDLHRLRSLGPPPAGH